MSLGIYIYIARVQLRHSHTETGFSDFGFRIDGDLLPKLDSVPRSFAPICLSQSTEPGGVGWARFGLVCCVCFGPFFGLVVASLFVLYSFCMRADATARPPGLWPPYGQPTW